MTPEIRPHGAARMSLGRSVGYPDTVDPHVLYPIARAAARSGLGIEPGRLPFVGADIWNAWEVSWLDGRGKPCIAIAEFRMPCTSPRLVESKSLKLYLGGYAMTRFGTAAAVREGIARDVSAGVGSPVEVVLREPAALAGRAPTGLTGESLDAQSLAIDGYAPPAPESLHTMPGVDRVEETLVTHLFRSRCPVTGQPDWGSVQIHYRGTPIDRAGLLRYLVSFRDAAGFHEACVERIFVDIRARCGPTALRVYARFLRRGGIDINPWRATPGLPAPPNVRGARQ